MTMAFARQLSRPLSLLPQKPITDNPARAPRSHVPPHLACQHARPALRQPRPVRRSGRFPSLASFLPTSIARCSLHPASSPRKRPRARQQVPLWRPCSWHPRSRTRGPVQAELRRQSRIRPGGPSFAASPDPEQDGRCDRPSAIASFFFCGRFCQGKNHWHNTGLVTASPTALASAP
jgi:hypothetical protein